MAPLSDSEDMARGLSSNLSHRARIDSSYVAIEHHNYHVNTSVILPGHIQGLCGGKGQKIISARGKGDKGRKKM